MVNNTIDTKIILRISQHVIQYRTCAHGTWRCDGDHDYFDATYEDGCHKLFS